jgi:hypothetical protein
LGLFVVSVSILKGVIVKSELPDALPLVIDQDRAGNLGLIIIANLNSQKAYKNHCTWKAILRAQNTITSLQRSVAFQHISVGRCFKRTHQELNQLWCSDPSLLMENGASRGL